MTKTKTNILGMLVVLLSPLPAMAVPVVQTATCADTANLCATGITGLEVAGMVLTVSFVTGSSYNAVYADNDPFFLGDADGSDAAQNAINAAFDGVIFGVVGQGSTQSRFFIPDLNDGARNFGEISINDSGSTDWRLAGYSTDNAFDFAELEPDFYTAYTLFELENVSIPEHGTLAILGFGLFGMAVARRKKQV